MEVAKILKVSTASVCRLWKQYKSTGKIEPLIPAKTRPRKVDYEIVRKYIEDNPDKILNEVGVEFGLTGKSIWYIMKKLNITYKKTNVIRGEKGRFTKRIPNNP